MSLRVEHLTKVFGPLSLSWGAQERFTAVDLELSKLTLDKLLQEDVHPTWEKVLEALGYTFLEARTDPMPSF